MDRWTSFMRHASAHILIATELRIASDSDTAKTLRQRASELGYQFELSAVPHTAGRSAINGQGVGILVPATLPLRNIKTDPNGRAIAAMLAIPSSQGSDRAGSDLGLIGLYGPSGATSASFQNSESNLTAERDTGAFLADATRKMAHLPIIAGGDLNCFAQPAIDTISNNLTARDASLCSELLRLEYIDSFRARHPIATAITFVGQTGGSRLDQLWYKQPRRPQGRDTTPPVKLIASGILTYHVTSTDHLTPMMDLGGEFLPDKPMPITPSGQRPKLFPRWRDAQADFSEAENDADAKELLIQRIHAATQTHHHQQQDETNVEIALADMRALLTIAHDAADGDVDPTLTALRTEDTRNRLDKAFTTLMAATTWVSDTLWPRYPVPIAQADGQTDAKVSAPQPDDIALWSRLLETLRHLDATLRLTIQCGASNPAARAAASEAQENAYLALTATKSSKLFALTGLRAINNATFPKLAPDTAAEHAFARSAINLRLVLTSPPAPGIAIIPATSRVLSNEISRRYRARCADRQKEFRSNNMGEWHRRLSGLTTNPRRVRVDHPAAPHQYLRAETTAEGELEHVPTFCETDADRAEGLADDARRLFTTTYAPAGSITTAPAVSLLCPIAPAGTAHRGPFKNQHHLVERVEFKPLEQIAEDDVTHRIRNGQSAAMAALSAFFRKFPHDRPEPHPDHDWGDIGACISWLAHTTDSTTNAAHLTHPLISEPAVWQHKPSSHPGLTGFKRFMLQLFPPEWRELYQILLALCLATGIVPDSARCTLLLALPKPDGGARYIGLLEEFLKQIDTATLSEIDTARYSNMRVDIISPPNRAYRRHTGTPSVLAQIWGVVDHANTVPDRRAYVLMYDLLKYFDTIVWPLVEAILRQMRLPETILRLLAELAADMSHAVLTPYGLSEWFCRERSGPQGRGSMCLISLINLEPVYLALQQAADPLQAPGYCPLPSELPISALLQPTDLPDGALDAILIHAGDLANALRRDRQPFLADQAAAGSFQHHILVRSTTEPTRYYIFPPPPQSTLLEALDDLLQQQKPHHRQPPTPQTAVAAIEDAAHTIARETSQRSPPAATLTIPSFPGATATALTIDGSGLLQMATTVAAAAARPNPTHHPYRIRDPLRPHLTIDNGASAFCDDGNQCAPNHASLQAATVTIANGNNTNSTGIKPTGTAARTTDQTMVGFRIYIPPTFDAFAGKHAATFVTYADPARSFTLLGAERDMTSAPPRTKRACPSDAYARCRAKLDRTLPYMLRLRMKPDEIAQGLASVTWPSIAHAALPITLDPISELIPMDIEAAKTAMKSAKAATTASPSLFFAAKPGFGARSLLGEYLASTARELHRSLTTTDPQGDICRADWSLRSITDPRQLPESAIARADHHLAQFGVFARSAHEDLLSRFLDRLAARLSPPPLLTPMMSHAQAANASARFRVLGFLAYRLRTHKDLKLNRLFSPSPSKTYALETPYAQRMLRLETLSTPSVNEWATILGSGWPTLADLTPGIAAEELDAALDDQNSDTHTECQIAGLPPPTIRIDPSWNYTSHSPTDNPLLNHIAESAIPSEPGAAIGTDGHDNQSTDPSTRVVSFAIVEAYPQSDPPQPAHDRRPPSAAALSKMMAQRARTETIALVRLPTRMGDSLSTINEAEDIAAAMAIVRAASSGGAPILIDRSSTLDIALAADPELAPTTTCPASTLRLAHARETAQRSAPHPAVSLWDQIVPTWHGLPGCRVPPSKIGSSYLVEVKSHQDRTVPGSSSTWQQLHAPDHPDGSPNAFARSTNEAVDSEADRAGKLPLPPDIKYPAPRPQFFFTQRCLMTTREIGKSIRSKAGADSLAHLATLPSQGALAHVADEAVPATVALNPNDAPSLTQHAPDDVDYEPTTGDDASAFKAKADLGVTLAQSRHLDPQFCAATDQYVPPAAARSVHHLSVLCSESTAQPPHAPIFAQTHSLDGAPLILPVHRAAEGTVFCTPAGRQTLTRRISKVQPGFHQGQWHVCAKLEVAPESESPTPRTLPGTASTVPLADLLADPSITWCTKTGAPPITDRNHIPAPPPTPWRRRCPSCFNPNCPGTLRHASVSCSAFSATRQRHLRSAEATMRKIIDAIPPTDLQDPLNPITEEEAIKRIARSDTRNDDIPACDFPDHCKYPILARLGYAVVTDHEYLLSPINAPHPSELHRESAYDLFHRGVVPRLIRDVPKEIIQASRLSLDEKRARHEEVDALILRLSVTGIVLTIRLRRRTGEHTGLLRAHILRRTGHLPETAQPISYQPSVLGPSPPPALRQLRTCSGSLCELHPPDHRSLVSNLSPFTICASCSRHRATQRLRTVALAALQPRTPGSPQNPFLFKPRTPTEALAFLNACPGAATHGHEITLDSAAEALSLIGATIYDPTASCADGPAPMAAFADHLRDRLPSPLPSPHPHSASECTLCKRPAPHWTCATCSRNYHIVPSLAVSERPSNPNAHPASDVVASPYGPQTQSAKMSGLQRLVGTIWTSEPPSSDDDAEQSRSPQPQRSSQGDDKKQQTQPPHETDAQMDSFTDDRPTQPGTPLPPPDDESEARVCIGVLWGQRCALGGSHTAQPIALHTILPTDPPSHRRIPRWWHHWQVDPDCSFSMPDEVSAWAHSSAFSSNPNPWMPANLALKEGSCQGLAPACISYLDDSSDVGSCPICRLKVSGAVSAPDTGMAASPQLRDERNHPTAADLGLTKAPHRIRTLAATQAAITKGRPSSATRAFAAPRQPPPADAAPPAQAAPAPPPATMPAVPPNPPPVPKLSRLPVRLRARQAAPPAPPIVPSALSRSPTDRTIQSELAAKPRIAAAIHRQRLIQEQTAGLHRAVEDHRAALRQTRASLAVRAPQTARRAPPTLGAGASPPPFLPTPNPATTYAVEPPGFMPNSYYRTNGPTLHADQGPDAGWTDTGGVDDIFSITDFECGQGHPTAHGAPRYLNLTAQNLQQLQQPPHAGDDTPPLPPALQPDAPPTSPPAPDGPPQLPRVRSS